MTIFKSALGAIVIAAGLSAAHSAQASTFVAWQVAGVPWGDTLNVRNWPAAHSAKQNAYPNGAVLSLTGRCTGGVNLFDISAQPVDTQKDAVRYKWCEVWHDPAGNGHYRPGWVYGKFIAPTQ